MRTQNVKRWNKWVKMAAKLIFYKPIGFNFCPIREGCENCFVNHVCAGKDDPVIALRLYRYKGHFQVIKIKERE